MYNIRTPGFTADQSLLPAERRYKTVSMWSERESVIEQSVIPQLRCLDWHCQGSECICIRFTTAAVTAGGVGNVLAL
jgi:hypothetical protein